MDIADYTARQLREVTIDHLGINSFSDGAPCAQIIVSAGLSSEDDPDVTGPSISLHLALPLDLKTPVQELEGAALRAAYALLIRASQESLGNFRAAFEKAREDAILTPQE